MSNTATRPLLKFNFGGNAKLSKEIVTFSLPSGYSCPGAKDCLAKADRETGKIIDGKHQKFRCFSAVSETRPAVRLQRWHNYALLKQAKTKERMEELIIESFPRGAKILRLHVGGDFFSQAYFDAWAAVAKRFYNCIIYAYTKSVNYVKAHEEQLPANFRITLSKGGKYDHLIEESDDEDDVQYGIAEVLGHPEEAEALELEVDHDDSHAIAGKQHFALLLHSMQPAGSEAAEKVKRMRKEGVKFSYPS
jgi:Gene product 88